MRWWVKLLIGLVMVALMAWLGWGMINGFVRLLNHAQTGDGEPDPMFAQEAELPTRPPELDEEGAFEERPTLDDYAPVEGAPVDKTVEELIREAQQRENE